jgi:Mg2+ and Co2+ transporter CorA
MEPLGRSYLRARLREEDVSFQVTKTWKQSNDPNKLNEVARTLTAYAAIFAALTLVSGVYGMNLEHMPELRWRLGYPYALVLMVGLAAELWGFFKRKSWL